MLSIEEIPKDAIEDPIYNSRNLMLSIEAKAWCDKTNIIYNSRNLMLSIELLPNPLPPQIYNSRNLMLSIESNFPANLHKRL